MHEYAITKEIMRLARETAEKSDIKEVSDVTIEVGELTGYVDESIIYYFDNLKESRERLHNAKLHCNLTTSNEIKIVSIKGE